VTVGQVHASDADGDAVNYAISTPGLDALFAVAADGRIEVLEALDYELQNSYSFAVTARDGIATSTATVEVNVADVNEAPVFALMEEWDSGEIVDDGSNFPVFGYGMILGQLSATDDDGDDLTYSTDGSIPWISVEADGSIVVSDEAGLWAYFETNETLSITVSVSDGFSNVIDQFILSKKTNWIDQSEIWYADSDGNSYNPVTATQLISGLQTIRNNGDQVTKLIIKGHAFTADGGGIEVGDDGEYLTVAGDDIYIGDIEVTQLLNDVTNGNSEIVLRGCFSKVTADRVEAKLDGADVFGAVRFVIGIPGTTWGFGVYQ